jgi:hypothetical protein
MPVSMGSELTDLHVCVWYDASRVLYALCFMLYAICSYYPDTIISGKVSTTPPSVLFDIQARLRCYSGLAGLMSHHPSPTHMATCHKITAIRPFGLVGCWQYTQVSVHTTEP